MIRLLKNFYYENVLPYINCSEVNIYSEYDSKKNIKMINEKECYIVEVSTYNINKKLKVGNTFEGLFLYLLVESENGENIKRKIKLNNVSVIESDLFIFLNGTKYKYYENDVNYDYLLNENKSIADIKLKVENIEIYE